MTRQIKKPARGSRHITPPKRAEEKNDDALVRTMMTGIDRIRREHGITLAQMTDEIGVSITAVSQHLNMARGYPDAQTTLKYLQFAERMEPGFAKKLLK